MEKTQAKEIISALVVRFEEQLESYKHSNYNETQTRRDFIDPFFKALGWDIDNQKGYAEAYREVIHEDKVIVSGVTKAPDYSFRLSGGKRLFFVEAKKPSVSVKDDIQPAYQVRRYGWSAKMPVSVITDFEEFAVYDCTKKPNSNESSSFARIKYLTFNKYIEEFDFFWETFSKEQVLKGSFDKFVKNDTNKKGTTTVDSEFLLSLDKWRTELAVNISKNNMQLDEYELNYVVQQTIDRLIFLRIAEDRSIEPYGALNETIKTGDYYNNLFQIFGLADQKYNSGLFDFKKDKLSKSLVVENKVLKNIIKELYYPACPYEFSVLSVEILGSAYEQFLGKIIRIDKNHRAKIDFKPEVRKSGGVYYTPQYIVDYIVKNTVGNLIEGKTPAEITKIKIVDPACGSGSFLIGAYQYLIDYHKNYYTEAGTKISKKGSPVTPEGNLTSNEKKRILLNNIYGVDIDTNAVEVTKLSLLLKCMEGENENSLALQYEMWHERILPTLDDNIKSGNSLIDTDFYDTEFDFGEDKKTKPFNWQKAFPEVFKQGGFHAVIGNPPYIKIQTLVESQSESVLNYFKIHYVSAIKGSYDIYILFIELALKLLNKTGISGFISPHKFFNSGYGENLRKLIVNKGYLKKIVHFDDYQIFANATTYTCLLFLDKKEKKDFEAFKFSSTDFKQQSLSEEIHFIKIDHSEWKCKDWNIISLTNNRLLKKLLQHTPLSELTTNIFQGPKSGADDVFILKMITNGTKKSKLYSKSLNKEIILESGLLTKYIKGKNIKTYLCDYSSNEYTIFPYHGNQLISKIELKEKFSLTWNYFTQSINRDILDTREEGRFKNTFWQYSRPQNMNILSNTKIITPFNAFKNSFAYDEIGDFIFSAGVSGAYGILLKEEKKNKYKTLLGILNSKVILYIIKNISTALRGGFYSYENKYLRNLPIPYVQDNQQIEIIKNVNCLLQLTQDKETSTTHYQEEHLQSRINYHKENINQIVFQLYNLTKDEIKIVELSSV